VATSYYGYGETERHFGLGNRANVDVVVEFPSGHLTRVNNVAANQTIRVLESPGSSSAMPGVAPGGVGGESFGTTEELSSHDLQRMGPARGDVPGAARPAAAQEPSAALTSVAKPLHNLGAKDAVFRARLVRQLFARRGDRVRLGSND
jgi:hypothetical protein